MMYVGRCKRCGKNVRKEYVRDGKHMAVAVLLIEDDMTRRIPCLGDVVVV